MCVTVWVLRYKNKKNGDRGTIVFTATLSLGMRRVFSHFYPGKSYNDHFGLKLAGPITTGQHRRALPLFPSFFPALFPFSLRCAMNDILELNAEREIAFERKPRSRQRSTPARLVTSAVIKYCTGACTSALFSKIQQPTPPTCCVQLFFGGI